MSTELVDELDAAVSARLQWRRRSGDWPESPTAQRSSSEGERFEPVPWATVFVEFSSTPPGWGWVVYTGGKPATYPRSRKALATAAEAMDAADAAMDAHLAATR